MHRDNTNHDEAVGPVTGPRSVEDFASAPTVQRLPTDNLDAGESIDGGNAAAEAIPGDPVPSAATPAVVIEDLLKACCICGLDISRLPRHRDRVGRYWCNHCQNFNNSAERTAASTPCNSCGRDTRQTMFAEQAGDKVCRQCNDIFLAEAPDRRTHKTAVTADPEIILRARIRQMWRTIGGLLAASIMFTLYHYGLLYVRPKAWVPFKVALYSFAFAAVAAGAVIGIHYIRIAWRLRLRGAKYDEMLRAAANQILALEEDTHQMGASESPELLRKRVERAVARVEAIAGRWDVANAARLAGADADADASQNIAGEIIESLAKKGDPIPLVDFLRGQRPGSVDIVARNREIATIGYLQLDFHVAGTAVTAILLRLPHDQDAMTRQALICFRNGDLEQSKKTFKRVVNIAREKKSEIDLAAAYCNLGMLHVMLSEFDDAAVRYSQAMKIYTSLGREAGQADCLVNLGLIAFRKKEKGVSCEPEFRQAMVINKRLHRREGLAICCSMLGVILMEKEKARLTEPERLLNRSVQLNLELNRPVGVATAYGNLGLIRVKRGDYTGARELFQKAQSIYQRINRPILMAKVQGMLKTLGTISAARAASK